MNEYPLFVFERQHEIERETGLTLAGYLIVDLPNSEKASRLEMEMVPEIVRRLVAEAQSGRMPTDAMVFGWRGGKRPTNAVDTNDAAVMTPWAKSRLSIMLRIDPRNDGYIRFDSEMMGK
jgi:hypothetical protein